VFLLAGILSFPAAAQTPTPALVLSPSPLNVDEGGSATYNVKLATQPSAEVSVNIRATAVQGRQPQLEAQSFSI